MQQKNIILWGGFAGVLILAAVAGFLLLKPPSGSPAAETLSGTETGTPQGNTVVYRNGAFSPQALTVRVGDRVEFRNEDPTPIWVASDPHPVHTDFASFDQRGTSPRGDTYVFTFTQSGTFKYHNHLSPAATGSIVVQ